MTTQEAAETRLPAVTLLQAGGRFALRLSFALLAVIYAVAACIPPAVFGTRAPAFGDAIEQLYLGLMFEGGFLMFQGTLIDIATRLKKRPPIWAVLLIGVVLLPFSTGAMDVLRIAWQSGSVVLVPLLVSLVDRFMVMWYMPDRTRVEKMGARALIGNRILTALILGGLMCAVVLPGWWPSEQVSPFLVRVRSTSPSRRTTNGACGSRGLRSGRARCSGTTCWGSTTSRRCRSGAKHQNSGEIRPRLLSRRL